MNKLVPLLLASLLAAAPAIAQASDDTAVTAVTTDIKKGAMLVDVSGARLAPIYRVNADGSAEIVFQGKMVTVPAATLSTSGGHVVTSLKKNQVLALR